MSLQSEIIETARLRFHLIRQGDPDGLPMLFLHGSYGSSRWWLPAFAYFPDDILAIAPDLRGCGQSDKPDDGYGIWEQAQDLWHLVTALGWDDFDLVAHSTSGAIAMEFALEHMDVLHSLTLVSSVPAEGVKSPIETLRVLSQMRTDVDLLTAALQAMMPAYFPLGDDAEKRRYFESLVVDAMGMAPAAFTDIAQAISGWNRFTDVQRLTLPTLLMWGDRDHVVDRELMTRTLIALPGAGNLEVLRGVGHSPMIEAPLTFAELLLNFVTEDFAEYDEVRDHAASDEVRDDADNHRGDEEIGQTN